MKFLLLMAIVLVLWWVWKKRPERGNNEATMPTPKQPEEIVACEHCGVLHPLSESVIDGSDHYCSTTHRLAARASKKP
ncbi:MAG: PP0621 family protein [Rhodocyclaceae bacterium]|nr:PP0621 family protein [Rhodocyclaceae bacterium]